MSVNFENSTDVVLRSLARRAFLQAKGDTTPVKNFDSKADPTVTLDQASQLLSGLLFLNFTNEHAWLYLNPRAQHPLKKDHVRELFDFMLPRDLWIDDFAHDNY